SASPAGLSAPERFMHWRCFDIGAHEYLLATADSNGDGIPDGWCQRFNLNPIDSNVAAGNPDDDSHTTFQEWMADTDPTNALSFFQITAISNAPPVTVHFLSSSNRQYTLLYCTNIMDSNMLSAVWTNVSGQIDVPGNGGMDALRDTDIASQKFYRVEVKAP
ncbi:MAG: hypothetical protein AAB676_17605, partial [Verrucomicrobiota bacterium]